ncbi:MAG TPA: ribosome maturation factor RimP [Nocardioidaceae bacterium]|nr:ribosome maturation factor RimP [Nocardioidaceae bacterium]
MSTTSLPDRLAELLAPAVARLGLELEAVELANAGRRRLLRVIVDADADEGTAGLTLDRLSDATRAVSQALDDADAMGEQPYTLEVTSPGVDRPLTLPRHWRRNVGRKVAVTTTDQTRRTGRIRAVGETSVTLDVGGTEVEMRYDDIAKALVQVEFNRKEG